LTDIEELAHTLFTVTRRSGKDDLMVVCPFHLNREGLPEKTGSLAFNIRHGMWFCHTCGVGGGLRKLLSKMNLDESMGDLLEQVEASREQLFEPGSPFCDVRIDPSLFVTESSLGFFDTRPGVAAEVLRWGFRPRTAFHFDVGYDTKHLRVTFPLRDYRGNLVGYSGRALGSHPARYKVYGEREYAAWGLPQLPPPPKGKIIWNYDSVYAALMRQWNADILVVEGFKACMWLWQLGFPHVVALLGSNMSREQQTMLERLGGTLYLFLDNDKAGDKKHIIGQRLTEGGCTVRIPTYPGAQPDTLKTADIVRQCMDNSQHIF
jgi:DNA primase